MDWQQSWRGGPIKHTHPSLKKANFVLVNIKGGKQDQMSSNVRELDPDPPKKSIISFLVLINFYFKISTHWTGTKSMLKKIQKFKKSTFLSAVWPTQCIQSRPRVGGKNRQKLFLETQLSQVPGTNCQVSGNKAMATGQPRWRIW